MTGNTCEVTSWYMAHDHLLFWTYHLLLLLFSTVTSQSTNDCNTTVVGSTINKGYEDVNIDLSSLPANKSQFKGSFIRFSACSDWTNFDTYLYLYNNTKTEIIDSCDDYCSTEVASCMENGKVSHDTVWDIDLYSLQETNYILEIKGYENQTGSYKLIISYDCTYDITVNKITQQPTTNPTYIPTMNPTQQPLITNNTTTYDIIANITECKVLTGTLNCTASAIYRIDLKHWSSWWRFTISPCLTNYSLNIHIISAMNLETVVLMNGTEWTTNCDDVMYEWYPNTEIYGTEYLIILSSDTLAGRYYVEWFCDSPFPAYNTSALPIISTSHLNEACNQDYPCPFKITNIYTSQNLDLYEFQFDASVVDDILRRSNWDEETFSVHNSRTQQIKSCVLDRNSMRGRSSDGTGSNNDFQIGDMLSFVDIDVFCDGKVCKSTVYESEQLSPIAVIVTLSVMICFVLCICIYSCYEDGEFDAPIKFAQENATASQVLKILSQVLISGCSIVGSLALSDSLGLSNFDNGVLAVTMGVITVLLACCKIVWAIGAAEKKSSGYSSLRDSDQDNAIILACTIFGATITDATFDIFQGVAAINGQEYTALTAAILVTATWLGVGEEIVEGTFEIGSSIVVDGFGECTDINPYVTIVIYYIMMLSAIAELSMGIYLFSTFSGAVYVGMGIAIQSLFLLFASLWFCYISFALITG